MIFYSGGPVTFILTLDILEYACVILEPEDWAAKLYRLPGDDSDESLHLVVSPDGFARTTFKVHPDLMTEGGEEKIAQAKWCYEMYKNHIIEDDYRQRFGYRTDTEELKLWAEVQISPAVRAGHEQVQQILAPLLAAYSRA